eukprot:4626690-Pleurochrysis_carterae.AAC.1
MIQRFSLCVRARMRAQQQADGLMEVCAHRVMGGTLSLRLYRSRRSARLELRGDRRMDGKIGLSALLSRAPFASLPSAAASAALAVLFAARRAFAGESMHQLPPMLWRLARSACRRACSSGPS